jgi:prepilin-type N-terminal cleavage/methylation domain-containing protein
MDRQLNKSGFTFMELLIVVGIFALIIGASLSIFSSGKLSFDVNEANIQAEEHARIAIERIANELRISRAGLVRISDNVNWTTSNVAGDTINLQIPVGSYAAQLTLSDDNSLQWGSEADPGHYLAYSVNANSQLVRSIYTLTDGSDATDTIIVPDISAISFSRTSTGSELITVVIDAAVQTSSGYTASRTLQSSIKIRN